MPTTFRQLAASAALLALTLAAAPAGATAYSSDYSDLWWNPAESGWGVQFVQQADTIFATMFVYDTGSNPVWYTATLNPAGTNVFRGDLNLTRGPWFGGAFNPATVTYRTVGTMTANFTALGRATLTYSVDGVEVAKAIERQTLRFENFNGTYALWLRGEATGCVGVAPGELLLAAVAAEVTQGPQVLSARMVVVLDQSVSTCTYSGNYSQSGHNGRSEGTYSCSGGVGTSGSSGTFVFSAMQVQQNTLTTNLLQRGQDGCTVSGSLGGVRGE